MNELQKAINDATDEQLIEAGIGCNNIDLDGNYANCKYMKNCVSGVINNEPTADVQPVQHGKWIEQGEPYINTYECSCCGRWFTLDYGTLKENNYNYCPKCGAKLKGEENL